MTREKGTQHLFMKKEVMMLKAISLIFALGCATAHSRPPPTTPRTPAPTVTVTIGWHWVPARWHRGVYVRGYWRHPTQGVHRRPYRHGPPHTYTSQPHPHSVWVPGRWVGQGRNRHWVPGHWQNRPPPRR